MANRCPKCNTDNPDTQKFCGECATPLSDSLDAPISHTKTLVTSTEKFQTGTTIAGRYEIIAELGKGGMGQVFKVKDAKINEEMALKLLRPEVASDVSTIERFQNELKLARRITHKNVCRLHDFHEEEDIPFITMEYVEGEDLKSLIKKKGTLTEEEAIAIAQQVCEGLAEAHELGVIHRDLKPQNIMIDDKGRAKIMDFGIARSVEARGVTMTGVIIGTPDYISPEQADGKEADQRSDIYSMGVILYEMMTGQVPFTGDTALSVALKHRSQYPLDPKKLNPKISDDLSRLILVCMEKEGNRRYPAVKELLNDLRNIKERFPLGTKIRPKKQTFVSSLIRKRLFIPASVVAVIILALIIWQLLPRRAPILSEPPDKPTLAILYFKNNTGDTNFDIWQEGLSSSVITDLSQSKFIRVLPSDRIYSILKKFDLLEARSYATEDLNKVAQEGEANYILQGSLSKAGTTFRIEYTLENILTGEIEGSNRFQGEGEASFFTMVDQLSNSLKSDLSLSDTDIASDFDDNFGKITTNSPEAYKYYIQGRRLHHELKFTESIEMMEKAIQIDPEFAMAYRSIFVSSGNTAGEYLQKAYELSLGDRISLRERLQIQGQYFHTVPGGRDRIKALEIFQRLLDLYPDDSMGNQFTGHIYLSWGQWEKALKYYEISIHNEAENYYYYTSAAQAYSRLGEYKKAQDLLVLYLEDYKYYDFMQVDLAWVHVLQGDYEQALVEIEKTISHDPENPQRQVDKGNILICKGDLGEAEAIFNSLLERKDLIQNPGIIPLFDLYMLQGKFSKCEKMPKDAISPYKWSYFYRKIGKFDTAIEEAKKHFVPQIIPVLEGMIYVDMGFLDKAQEAAQTIAEIIEKEYEKNRFYYFKGFHKYLMGRIELARKNFPEAILLLEEALSIFPKEFIPSPEQQIHAVLLEPLAKAYYESGDLKKAAETYTAITELTLGRLEFGDIYSKAFYMLGKIHEEQGDKSKAIANYEKFLELWKNADPGLPEVEDAKNSLAGLIDR